MCYNLDILKCEDDTMKRMASLILVLVLATGMFALSVQAEDMQVRTEEELIQAVATGGTVVLGADIELQGYVEIMADTVLDLNGHTLSAAQETYSVVLMSRRGSSVVIRDSVGGGGLFDADAYVYYSQESTGSLTVEGGHIANVNVVGGTLTLSGGNIDMVEFDGAPSSLYIVKEDAATVSEWVCGRGTVNFDPSNHLKTGYEAINNGDGTYTIQTTTVEKIGETITVFYDAYIASAGKYALTRNGVAPEALRLLILNVNDGEPEIIEMERLDEEGRLWRAQIDKAYQGAGMCVANEEEEISTVVVTVPNKNGMTLNTDNEWIQVIYWDIFFAENLVWLILGALGMIAAVTAVVIVLQRRKRCKEQ